jgi:hypothetical protein
MNELSAFERIVADSVIGTDHWHRSPPPWIERSPTRAARGSALAGLPSSRSLPCDAGLA